MSRSSVILPLVLGAGAAGLIIYAGTGLNAQKTLAALKVSGFKNLKLKKDYLQLDLIVVNAAKTETTLSKIAVDVSLDGNHIGVINYEGKLKVAARSKENPNGITTIKNIKAVLQDGLSIISSMLDYFGKDTEAKNKTLNLDGVLTAGGMKYPFKQNLPFKINQTKVSGVPSSDTTTWTPERKKKAHEELLNLANNYEVKRRKQLRGIRYLNDGSARWNGQAHDYTVWISQLLMF